MRSIGERPLSAKTGLLRSCISASFLPMASKRRSTCTRLLSLCARGDVSILVRAPALGVYHVTDPRGGECHVHLLHVALRVTWDVLRGERGDVVRASPRVVVWLRFHRLDGLLFAGAVLEEWLAMRPAFVAPSTAVRP